METLLNDGYCPECQLNDEDVQLLLNKDDFWECPKSHLQLAVNGIDAVILRFRAIGQFRSEPAYGTYEINGAVLTRAKEDSIFSDHTIFNSEAELKEYLINEVEPPLDLSLENLADSYVKFKYGNPFTKENNPLPYKRLSKFFKIDFENRNILKKLEKRDSEEDVPYLRSYTHLYRLLLSLFEKYYNADASWLPEMGMSQIEVDLCIKYFSVSEAEQTNDDQDVVKKTLMAFMVDLIEIIYQGKKPVINGNGSASIDDTSLKSVISETLTLTLQDILSLKTDLLKNSRVKLVRHKDNRYEYKDLIKDKSELLKYQRQQSKEVFKDCDYIISFIGLERRKSLLFGVFKVNGIEKTGDHFYYDLVQIPEFDYLVDRVVIDWGDNAIAWHQWYHKQPKEVIQIFPKGYLGTFSGLLDFVLDFEELKKLITNAEANHDWKAHLSAVNGIYMILDSNTGNQYIGSACGNYGIWQRWSEYVATFHGGNKRLIDLCATADGYYKNFKFSVLQALPSNITQKEIVAIENLYKQKLGTRAYGLNSN